MVQKIPLVFDYYKNSLFSEVSGKNHTQKLNQYGGLEWQLGTYFMSTNCYRHIGKGTMLDNRSISHKLDLLSYLCTSSSAQSVLFFFLTTNVRLSLLVKAFRIRASQGEGRSYGIRDGQNTVS